MVNTCTSHGLSTLIIDNWAIEIVRSCNKKIGAIINGQSLKTCANVMYCNWCGCGLFEHFLSFVISLLSPYLVETTRYRLKFCLKRPLNPKQPTTSCEFRLIRNDLCFLICIRSIFIKRRKSGVTILHLKDKRHHAMCAIKCNNN